MAIEIAPPKPLEEQLLEAHEGVAELVTQTLKDWQARGWPDHTGPVTVKTEAEVVMTGMSGLKLTLELIVFGKPDDAG